jgi:mRNA-degrading endonuclease RelE of RelBE toxin-antitoxin system
VTGERDDVPYQVQFAPTAAKELGRLRADDAARLRRSILGLAFEPRPVGARGVVGTRYLRLRVGDLRVIHLIVEDEPRVVITRIAKRSEHTYRL